MKTLIVKKKGITLIELMIVIAVLSIISAIAYPAYQGYVRTGYRAECVNEVAAIQLAEEEFFLENNNYFSGTGASTLETQSNNIYQASADALDAANTNCTYAVTVAGNSYTITATGANKLASEGVVITKTK
jgi:type IV pilus assembly protein PilE